MFLIHPKQPLSHLAQELAIEAAASNPHTHSQDYNVTFHGRFKDPDRPDEQTVLSKRWALSTEVGEFVKDAIRDSMFTIVLKRDAKEDVELPVRVPTFEQRTHYLRLQLRTVSSELENYLQLKQECDDLAYRDARRFAYLGLGGLGTYWFAVQVLTLI